MIVIEIQIKMKLKETIIVKFIIFDTDTHVLKKHYFFLL